MSKSEELLHVPSSIQGFKILAVERKNDKPYLVSPIHYQKWDSSDWMHFTHQEKEFTRTDESISEDCKCGLYAANYSYEAERYKKGLYSEHVLALVEGKGKTIVGTGAFRTSQMKIKALAIQKRKDSKGSVVTTAFFAFMFLIVNYSVEYLLPWFLRVAFNSFDESENSNFKPNAQTNHMASQSIYSWLGVHSFPAQLDLTIVLLAMPFLIEKVRVVVRHNQLQKELKTVFPNIPVYKSTEQLLEALPQEG